MGDGMTPKERIETTIKCEQPDRIPVTPMIGFFAALYTGTKASEFELNPEIASKALEKTLEKLGGVDQVFPSWGIGLAFTKLLPLKVLLPGTDLPEDTPHQIVEEEIMKVEDYDLAIEEGLGGLYAKISERLGRELTIDTIIDATLKLIPQYEYWENEKKIPVENGGTISIPVDYFSMARSLPEFSKDVFRRPEKIVEASDAIIQDCVNLGEMQCEALENKTVFIGATRASATFMSEKMFLKFFFPYLKECCETLIKDGYTPLLHFDNDWTPFLEHFLELPKRKCILDLDGFTDIFKAKEVLDGHMCIQGDVPATILAYGTPKEVEKYCKKLIDVVGEGGGFILSSGCEVPYNAKFENVKVIVDSAKKYGKYS